MQNIHKPTERVIKVLRLLANNSQGYTLTEIAEKTEIPKGTLFPILQTLHTNNFISQSKENMKYIIGIDVFKIGNSFLENIEILPKITEHMNDIVNVCNEICQLGILDNGNVLYIAKIDSPQPIKLASAVGTTLPAYSTALGKSLLSQYSKEEIKELYEEGLKKFTPNTITDIDELYEDISKSKSNNIYHEVGESNEHVECIAVPLVNNGKIFASLSVSLPIYRSNEDKIEQIKEQLLYNKEKIERELKGIEVDVSMFYV